MSGNVSKKWPVVRGGRLEQNFTQKSKNLLRGMIRNEGWSKGEPSPGQPQSWPVKEITYPGHHHASQHGPVSVCTPPGTTLIVFACADAGRGLVVERVCPCPILALLREWGVMLNTICPALSHLDHVRAYFLVILNP